MLYNRIDKPPYPFALLKRIRVEDENAGSSPAGGICRPMLAIEIRDRILVIWRMDIG